MIANRFGVLSPVATPECFASGSPFPYRGRSQGVVCTTLELRIGAQETALNVTMPQAGSAAQQRSDSRNHAL